MYSYNEKMQFNKILPKLTIKFKSEREYLYTGWEINQITHSCNTTYYKNELLNSIKSLIENGVDPKNIFVLNASVKIGHTYDSIKDKKLNLKNERDLINFYSMGSPIPLIPNDFSLKMFHIFELYRFFYKEYSSLNLNMPKRKKVIYQIFDQLDFFSEFNTLRNYLYEEIKKNNLDILDQVKNNSEVEKIRTEISKLFKKFDYKFRDFDEKIKNINKANDFYREYTSIDDEEKLNLKENISAKIYSSLFSETFNNHDRPIVGVYNSSDYNVEILCTDLISVKNFTEDNYRFFETKQISQNSPLLLMISVGIGFLPSIMKICESLYHNKQLSNSIISDIEDIEQRKKDLLNEINEIDEIDEMDRRITRIEDGIDMIIDEVEAKDHFYKQTLFINKDEVYGIDKLAVNKSYKTVIDLKSHNDANLCKTLKDKKINIETVTSEAN